MTQVNRRVFIRTLGKGSLAVAFVGLGACADQEPAVVAEAPPTTNATTLATAPESPTTPAADPPPAPEAGGWSRVDLGFVSAYIFVRGGEAALVDTGTGGSAEAIGAVLGDLGLGYADLSTVVLTHHHGDHIGSLPEVMTAATGATAYAGAEDIPNITSPRPVSAVADGDTVFGLEVIATPGHTPGHVALLDPSGVLVAGDALNGSGGGVTGPNPQFTPDMGTANDSVIKLAGLDFEVAYFGHGEPVLEGAADQVADLASTL